MKDINTLIEDVYDRLSRIDVNSLESVEGFGHALGAKLASRLSEERGEPSLRFSNLGWPDRKLWYSVNHPELGEPLTGDVHLKFRYGDILEEFLLFLAREAGHTVEHEQLEVSCDGVKGHIDGFIDGMLVDAKSCSPYSFEKFKAGLKAGQDSFGYLGQLSSYSSVLHDHPSNRYPGEAAFLAINKVSGEICLDVHRFDKGNLSELVRQKRAAIARWNPPERCYPDEAEGASGNRKLGVVCSYCAYKAACWPGLKLLKDYRPVFLTKVVRPPKYADGRLKELIPV